MSKKIISTEIDNTFEEYTIKTYSTIYTAHGKDGKALPYIIEKRDGKYRSLSMPQEENQYVVGSKWFDDIQDLAQALDKMHHVVNEYNGIAKVLLGT